MVISDVHMDDGDGRQLEDLNDNVEGNNDLEHVDNNIDDNNDLEDAANNIDDNNEVDITQVNERPKRKIIYKLCGTGSHKLYQHGRKGKK